MGGIYIMELHFLKDPDNNMSSNIKHNQSNEGYNNFRVIITPHNKYYSYNYTNTFIYYKKDALLSYEDGLAYKNKRIKPGLLAFLFLNKEEREFIKAINLLVEDKKSEALKKMRKLVEGKPAKVDVLFTLALLTNDKQERETCILTIINKLDNLGLYYNKYNINLLVEISLFPEIMINIINDKTGFFIFCSEVLYLSGSHKKAIDLLENSGLMDLPLIRLFLGNLYYELQQYDKAIRLLQGENNEDPVSVLSLMLLGKSLREVKLYKSAVETLRKARRRTAKKPTSLILEGRYQLGITFELLEKNHLACREYEKILASDYDFKDVKKRIITLTE